VRRVLKVAGLALGVAALCVVLAAGSYRAGTAYVNAHRPAAEGRARRWRPGARLAGEALGSLAVAVGRGGKPISGLRIDFRATGTTFDLGQAFGWADTNRRGRAYSPPVSASSRPRKVVAWAPALGKDGETVTWTIGG
jgi:hypothetical protein